MKKAVQFLNKEAAGNMRAFNELSENAVGLLGLLIAIPATAGVVSGVTTSKMTSPTDSDVSDIQDRIVDEQVRAELGLQQRKLDALKRKMRNQAKIDQRSIGRKRDMFV